MARKKQRPQNQGAAQGNTPVSPPTTPTPQATPQTTAQQTSQAGQPPIPTGLALGAMLLRIVFGVTINIWLIFWLFVVVALVGRLVTLAFLASGHEMWAIGLDTLFLLPLFFFGSNPALLAIALAEAGLASSKSNQKEFETELASLGGTWFNLLTGAFVMMFIIPDVFGVMAGSMPFEQALKFAILGIFAGLLSAWIGFEGKLVYRATLALIAVAFVHDLVGSLDATKFGSKDSWTEAAINTLQDVWLIIDILTFWIVMGGTPWSWIKDFWKWLTFWRMVGVVLFVAAFYIGYSVYHGTVKSGSSAWKVGGQKAAAVSRGIDSFKGELNKPLAKVPYTLTSLESQQVCGIGLPDGEYQVEIPRYPVVHYIDTYDNTKSDLQMDDHSSGKFTDLPYNDGQGGHYWDIALGDPTNPRPPKVGPTEIQGGCLWLTPNIAEVNRKALKLTGTQEKFTLVIR